MAFKVSNISVDLMNNTANLVAYDQTDPQHPKTLQLTFPFDPPNREGKEKDLATAAAKALLQQAAADI
jgi:hypothetical protein